MDKEIKAYCNKCHNNTWHRELLHHVNKKGKDGNERDWVDWSSTWQIYECKGCEEIFMLRSDYFSEDSFELRPYYNIQYFPKRAKNARRKPDWYDDFDVFPSLAEKREASKRLPDPIIVSLYQEVYALNVEGFVTSSVITARALLENIAVIENGDNKSFKKNIAPFVERGIISVNQAEELNSIIYECGSAVMHRGHKPDKDSFNTVMDAIENLIFELYIKPSRIANLKSKTPERSQKTKKD